MTYDVLPVLFGKAVRLKSVSGFEHMMKNFLKSVGTKQWKVKNASGKYDVYTTKEILIDILQHLGDG